MAPLRFEFEVVLADTKSNEIGNKSKTDKKKLEENRFSAGV